MKNSKKNLKILSKYKILLIYFRYSKLEDEYRIEGSNKYGGMDCLDYDSISSIRSVGWDLIKQVGKKIISGDFNLTRISIPIKVMMPFTILQTIALSIFNIPYFLNIASLHEDPIEKLKYVITASISCYHKSFNFKKPVTI